MGTILSYELNKEREKKLRETMKLLGHQVKTVGVSLYGESLGYVAGIQGFRRSFKGGDTAPLGEEMLVFSGLSGDEMELSLEAMKAKGLFVSLKAVLTPYNIQWSSRALYGELARERANLR